MNIQGLEVVIKSARGLKDVNLFSKMGVYTVVSIHSDNNNYNSSKKKTPIDKHGGTNPEWNFPMRFTFDVAMAMQITLVVKLKARRWIFRNKDIGEVRVPMMELLESFVGAKGEKHVSYMVMTPSMKLKGELDFSYKFGEVKQYPLGVATGTEAEAEVGSNVAGPPPPGGLVGAYPHSTAVALAPYLPYPPPAAGGYQQVGYGYPPPQNPSIGSMLASGVGAVAVGVAVGVAKMAVYHAIFADGRV